VGCTLVPAVVSGSGNSAKCLLSGARPQLKPEPTALTGRFGAPVVICPDVSNDKFSTSTPGLPVLSDLSETLAGSADEVL
jgi:hypothetical protein